MKYGHGYGFMNLQLDGPARSGPLFFETQFDETQNRDLMVVCGRFERRPSKLRDL